MSTSAPGAPDIRPDPPVLPARRVKRVRYDAVVATFIAVLAVLVSGTLG
jgi:hypothetical protein